MRQTILPLRPTMAMKLDSRLLITMLSGAKRASPSSYQWFGPTYAAALMCSQSSLSRARLNPRPRRITLRASAENPNSSA